MNVNIGVNFLIKVGGGAYMASASLQWESGVEPHEPIMGVWARAPSSLESRGREPDQRSEAQPFS